MFMFGFSSYMRHAFPLDDLRPISCGGHNTQGGIANTLIDSLDALLVCGAPLMGSRMPCVRRLPLAALQWGLRPGSTLHRDALAISLSRARLRRPAGATPTGQCGCNAGGALWQVVDARAELRDGVRWAEAELSLDLDVRAHVFELTIRALGGLISTHSLLVRDPTLVPGGCRAPPPSAGMGRPRARTSWASRLRLQRTGRVLYAWIRS